MSVHRFPQHSQQSELTGVQHAFTLLQSSTRWDQWERTGEFLPFLGRMYVPGEGSHCVVRCPTTNDSNILELVP